jgi:hypothetical protein
MRRAQVVPGYDGDGIGMTSRPGSTVLRCSAAASRAAKGTVLGMVLGACALGLAVSALAQEVQAPSLVPGQVPNQAPNLAPSETPNQAPGDPNSNPPPAFRPGFIDVLGRWLEQGASKLKSDMQGAQEKADQLGSKAREAAKEATGALGALPTARAVTARERCVPAQNGAPDCLTAAVTLCRGKGFQTGKSLDTQSEQKCPAKVLLEGRAPNATDCPPEMFVTRAMCQ